MDDSLYDNMKKKSKLNIFKDYLSFLNKLDELNKDEKEILNSFGYEFINLDKKNYISLERKNPVKFLLKSSSEFFYEHNNYVSLNDELEKFLNNNVFIENVKDTIDFRTKEFYKNRYEKK
ncbi:hypothetical protein [Clostridium sp. CCUG 7971]|uniref:hypothetical protein n=1 Tax=Clostridium sp. CCUG 7971 TaxID=2811414 RepID=UPI001ABB76C0|nr:hypothetical protein [Clostridium sp. CCUG 7971]MBO3445283.1 hypothetical protein [Clostridium sp. CCUG 7971]